MRVLYDTQYIAELINLNYSIKVEKIISNPRNGFLGETYVINDRYFLKIPKRGGIPGNIQGNVRFSALIMNEANLHGIAAPLNLKTKDGFLYAYDSKVGYFHLMSYVDYEPPTALMNKNEKLAYSLGFHASSISLMMGNFLKFHKNENLQIKDYIDHWSVEASLNKLYFIFGITDDMSEKKIKDILIRSASNLSKFSNVPKTLIVQLLNHEPLKVIKIARQMIDKTVKNPKTRRCIIHNDIKPSNLAFYEEGDSKLLRCVGSFDYTMSCFANPIKNIAGTVIDSYIDESDFNNYKEIYSIAKGSFFGLNYTRNEIISVEDEIIVTIIKKYALRWEYWRHEVSGRQKSFQVDFVDPGNSFKMLQHFNERFLQESLSDNLLELYGEICKYKSSIIHLKEFLCSNEYVNVRLKDRMMLRKKIENHLIEAYQVFNECKLF